MSLERIKALVVDTAPLLENTLQGIRSINAEKLYTTSGVVAEIKDEKSRADFQLGAYDIEIRQPKTDSIKKGNLKV